MSENSDSQTALRRVTHDHDNTSTAQARAGALMSPPPCLGGASHGLLPVDTHSTPVLPKGTTLRVAHSTATTLKILQQKHKTGWLAGPEPLCVLGAMFSKCFGHRTRIKMFLSRIVVGRRVHQHKKRSGLFSGLLMKNVHCSNISHKTVLGTLHTDA